MSCKAVPESMGGDFPFCNKSGRRNGKLHFGLDVLYCNRMMRTSAGKNKRTLGSKFLPILAEELIGIMGQKRIPLTSALALPDKETHLLRIDIRNLNT